MRYHRFTLPAVVLGVLALAPAAFADLNPPPPDFYTCSPNGGGTICRASRVEHEDPVPVEGFCSVDMFDQGDIHQQLTRRYDAEGNWTERVVRDRWLNSFWSAPSTGNTIPYTQRDITTDRLGVPGDPDTITETQVGENQYTDPVTHKKVLHSVGRTVFSPTGDLLESSGQQPFLAYFGGQDPHACDNLCAAIAG